MADYIQELSEKLEGSRKRVREGRQAAILKENAPLLFDIIDTEITLAVNKMTQNKPVSYDEYLDLHGQVVGIRRIRNLIDSKEVEAAQAQQEVTAIEGNLKQLKDDQKKQQ